MSLAGGLGPSVVPYMYFLPWNRHLELCDTLHTMLCLLCLSTNLIMARRPFNHQRLQTVGLAFSELLNIISNEFTSYTTLFHIFHVFYIQVLGCVSSLRRDNIGLWQSEYIVRLIETTLGRGITIFKILPCLF